MNVGIVGITGRVGCELAKLISTQNLVGGISSKTSTEECERIVRNSDVIVDFSRPMATLRVLSFALEHNVPFVSGTTGFTSDEFNLISDISKQLPVFYSSNFSLSVQFIAESLKQYSKLFPETDFSIVERHHAHKKDSPSGTALFLAGQVQNKKQIASIRAGNLFGEHACTFTGNDEEVTFSHTAFNRIIYARGALQCAEWLIGKPAKLYMAGDFLQDMIHGNAG